MVRLEKSETLQRLIRKDDLPELGISTVTRILDAIDNNRLSEAKELVQYLWIEIKGLHDIYADWCWAFMDRIAEQMGEEGLFQVLKETQRQRQHAQAKMTAKADPEEGIRVTAEYFRAHRSGPEQLGTFLLRDEGDKYVMELDPCGSGGRMRRGDPADGTPPRTQPPYNFGSVEKAYPWTWSKPGVARYCVHCCVNEIIGIESRGYPTWIVEYSDDPERPCRRFLYKDPKSIPEKFFTRVGKSKP